MLFTVAVAALVSTAFVEAANLPQLDNKIVGGVLVDIESYPYQISLQYNGRHACGGAVISEKFIVTAAHCTDGATASALTVRVGSSKHNSGGTVISVRKIHQHPSYNARLIDYDVAVLELQSFITPQSGALKIRLPYSLPTPGKSAVVSGWGFTKEGGSLPEHLQAVVLPVISNADCVRRYGDPQAFTDRMFCAGFPTGGKDACQGDSGGPLVADGELIGIVSWGYGCARPQYPGVYTNVAKVRPFITRVTNIF